MNITEAFDAKLESASTFSQTPRAAASALAVFFLVAQHQSHVDLHALENHQYRNAHSGTRQVTVERELGANDLLDAIIELHATLLAQQTELDLDAKVAIYRNLWDLYE